MTCIINWDAQTIESVKSLEADGCIVQWLRTSAGVKAQPVSPEGCVIQWDAATKVQSVSPGPESGCIIKWVNADEKVKAYAELGGCIVDWKAVTPEQARARLAAAEKGCIIDW